MKIWLETLCLVLATIRSAVGDVDCGPIRELKHSFINETANPDAVILSVLQNTTAEGCNTACCEIADIDDCNVAAFKASDSSCTLALCLPAEDCVTANSHDYTLTFVGPTLSTTTSTSTATPSTTTVSSSTDSTTTSEPVKQATQSSATLASTPSEPSAGKTKNTDSDKVSRQSSKDESTEGEQSASKSSTGKESITEASASSKQSSTAKGEQGEKSSGNTPKSSEESKSTENIPKSKSDKTISTDEQNKETITGTVPSTESTPPSPGKTSVNSKTSIPTTPSNEKVSTSKTTSSPITSTTASSSTVSATRISSSSTTLFTTKSIPESKSVTSVNNTATSTGKTKSEASTPSSTISSPSESISESKTSTVTTSETLTTKNLLGLTEDQGREFTTTTKSETSTTSKPNTELETRTKPNTVTENIIQAIQTTNPPTDVTEQNTYAKQSSKLSLLTTSRLSTEENGATFTLNTASSNKPTLSEIVTTESPNTTYANASVAVNSSSVVDGRMPAPDAGIEPLAAGLVAALSLGTIFFFAVLVLLGKRLFDSWQRRHYNRMDYLINGMYN